MDRRVESDDASLVARTLAGDQSAFAALVSRHESDVYHLALRYLRQREDAEDVVQEAFVRAYRALAQYDPLRPFGAWMHAITARLCIDFHRRRRVKTVSLTRPEEGSASEEREWEIADPTEGPETLTERGDEAARLESLIDRLPPDYRLAILLRHAHDLSYEEIAEATGAPIGTVKARIHRARNLLREWIEAGQGPEGEVDKGAESGDLPDEKNTSRTHPGRPIFRKEDR